MSPADVAWYDQAVTDARQQGVGTAAYWKALRDGGVPRWLAAALTWAWLTDHPVYIDED